MAELPPVRVPLVWEKLTGHQTPERLKWLVERGVWPISTPLGGAWLHLVESVQRSLVHRALAGQQPRTAVAVMAWLAAAVVGWTADSTPFAWGGKRAARQRAREPQHALGGSGGYTRRPIPRTRRAGDEVPLPNGDAHVT